MQQLRQSPAEIQQLVCSEDESEMFRFGNGGCVSSSKRWRLPIMVGSTLALLWVSIVPVTSLGCLLGRDLLDALGAVLDFARRTLCCEYLNERTICLEQMLAGHFRLKLLPNFWPAPCHERWRRVGFDGVLEVQIGRQEWLRRRVSMQDSLQGHRHEHLLTEHGLRAAVFSSTLPEPSVANQPAIPPAACWRPTGMLTPAADLVTLVAQRWHRLCLRISARALWHVRGILLWLAHIPRRSS